MLNDRGSAVVESIFAIVFLMVVVVGVIQVAFTLYARNVIASSAHEGARAAVELGRTAPESQGVAERTVHSAVGGLIDELDVGVSVSESRDVQVFKVVVSGSLKPFGLVPISIPVTAEARASRPAVTP